MNFLDRFSLDSPYEQTPWTNSVEFGPQTNYTDWETCTRLLRVGCVAWSVQRIPAAAYLGFLDRCRFFFQVAPQLSSWGWADPVPQLLLKKSGSAGNRTRDLWICSQEL
jgi:hypothetical protein